MKNQREFLFRDKLLMRLSASALLITISLQSLLAVNTIVGQKVSEVTVEINSETSSLGSLFQEIEDQTIFNFVVSEDQIDLDLNVRVKTGQQNLEKLLKNLASNYHLEFEQLNKAIIITRPNKLADQKFTISGYITDASDGEVLIGANIFATKYKIGAVTNSYGFYSITLPSSDTLGIVFSFIGYTPQIKKLRFQKDMILNIELAPVSRQLDEAVVIASLNDDNIEKAQMGVIDVPISKINELPAILGETDVLKIIQLLPGVQSGNEGTTGFYVRGGNADQNLVQLDEATVYNPNHLFGLFSTFNSRALNDVSLIKGGFPAQYGGRLSSILDISMKEGNNRKTEVNGGLGLISSQLTVEGPLKTGQASYIISARRTYLDLLLRPVLPQGQNTIYHFYDINAKVNWQIGSKDKVFLSFFKGLDDAAYRDPSRLSYGMKFGNSTATLRWNHLFGNKLFLNTSLIYNDYLLKFSTTQNQFSAEVFSGITDVSAKAEFQYFPGPKHDIRFGSHYIQHNLRSSGKSEVLPKDLQANVLNINSIPSRYFNELALYFNDEIQISDVLSLNLGVRTPFFLSSDVNYYRIEPRASVKVSTSHTSSIKTSFTVMNQFLHLVPNATATLPIDIWIPSSGLTKPQLSEQVALGYFQNFASNKYESSIEFYYKTMDNQIAFKEGNQLLENQNIDNELVYGKGWSYGAEFFLKKKTGRLTGWASYTLSWTNQQFPDLNNGESFPFKYDRRHVLSLVGVYKLNEKWSLSANFVFSSGSVITLPVGRVTTQHGGTLFPGYYYVYENRNNYRLASYHRLDVSASYRKKRTFFGKEYNSEWVFGLYNAYSRQNPYFAYLTVDPNNDQPKAYQVSLLPIIPSVTFNFNF